VQVRDLCRLLGLPRGIGELGCVHLEGTEVRYELGAFPFVGETPVDAMLGRGALELVRASADLEAHDPWNEGREATLILRGRADVDAVNKALVEHGFAWCELVDNGALFRHGIERAQAAYVGDSAADLACAPEVAACWLVANAEPDLEWSLRTAAPYGAGVAEVISRLLAS
jgi:hypothetical protein